MDGGGKEEEGMTFPLTAYGPGDITQQAPLWKHRSRCIAQIDIRHKSGHTKHLHPDEPTLAGVHPPSSDVGHA